MALYSWNDTYAVKVREIDQQHRQLLAMVDDLYNAMKEGKARDIMGKTLNGLITYTQTHFKTEETLMTQYNYPNYRQHKAIHDGFVAKAADMQEKFKAGSLTLSLDTMKYLGQWVQQHIMETDKQLGVFLSSKGVH